MKEATQYISPDRGRLLLENIFAALIGAFIGLALLKFGNPVILENKIAPPANFDEVLHSTWPIRWSYPLFLPLIIFGFLVGRWKKPQSKWLFVAPLVWLGWTFISATQTVSLELTVLTLKHFTACVVCFYLGWFALAEMKSLTFFWIPIWLAFLWLLRIGFEQHFGGLQQLREYLQIYVLPLYENPPPELLKRVATNRIFATLVYPNAFAGVLLFFAPSLFAVLWKWLERLTLPSRIVLMSCIGLATLACLYWTGSKTGWLLALFISALMFLKTSVSRKIKIFLVIVLSIGGLIGFFVRFSTFFEKGATSVVARFDYWRAATKISEERPLFGSGPGTFSVLYQKIKAPEAEMARLCHNDYLEQISDSGIIGFLVFSGFVIMGLLRLYRYRNSLDGFSGFFIFIGLFAFALQSLMEFGFYIPALAWPFFLLLGWSLGRENRWTRQAEPTNLAKK